MSTTTTITSLPAATLPLSGTEVFPVDQLQGGSLVTVKVPVSAVGGTGTVTSVSVTVPFLFTVTGSPVTSAGTIAIGLASQSANLVLASPNGSAGQPLMRALTYLDTPASLVEGDVFADFVATGLLTPVPASSLTGVMAPGVCYAIGQRVVKLLGDASLTFTYAISSDTYDDISNVGVITHVAVANGALAPAVTANSLRLQKVVTNGTVITGVTRLGSTTLVMALGINGTPIGASTPSTGSFTALAVVNATFAAGTATVAPVKYTAGPILTTAVDGAFGYDGAKYWRAVGAVWYRDVYSNSLALPSAPAVGASPFTYQNTADYDVDVIVVGGTVSSVTFSRDGTTYYALGILQVPILLSPGDRLQITYTVAPTLTLIPR